MTYDAGMEHSETGGKAVEDTAVQIDIWDEPSPAAGRVLQRLTEQREDLYRLIGSIELLHTTNFDELLSLAFDSGPALGHRLHLPGPDYWARKREARLSWCPALPLPWGDQLNLRNSDEQASASPFGNRSDTPSQLTCFDHVFLPDVRKVPAELVRLLLEPEERRCQSRSNAILPHELQRFLSSAAHAEEKLTAIRSQFRAAIVAISRLIRALTSALFWTIIERPPDVFSQQQPFFTNHSCHPPHLGVPATVTLGR